ncbi:MAG: cytochrome c [Rhodothermales bacterium]|nr:cytochrome c [Rhodothermales bacterium]
MKKALKYTGIGLLVVVVGIAIFAFVTINSGADRLSTTYALDYDPADATGDSASVARGEYIAMTHGCMDCHTSDLSGQVMADAPPFRMVASNLTPGTGGIGSTYSDADWLRSIRHGVGPDGRGLFVMPAAQYYYLSDEEAGDLVAYLKTLEPVDNELPPTEFKTLGKFIAGMDENFKLEPDMMMDVPRVPMPAERGPTAEWGRYRTSTICTICHGTDLTGGQPPDPGSPPAPDLRVAASWDLDGFRTALRTGETPDGRQLDGYFMPWEAFRHMTDDEIEAIHRHLQTL